MATYAEKEFLDYWLGQIDEVVDNYGPDIIWFDSWLDRIPENYRQKMVAHHFNTAVSRGQHPIVAIQTGRPARQRRHRWILNRAERQISLTITG